MKPQKYPLTNPSALADTVGLDNIFVSVLDDTLDDMGIYLSQSANSKSSKRTIFHSR